MNVLAPMSPLRFFQLFFTREVLEYMTKETNKYASFRLEGNAEAWARWITVNIRDMAQFLGLVFLMGLLKFPEIRLYWSQDPLYHHPIFGQTMCINRFKEILKYFHTFNNLAIQHGNTDRLIKVRTLMEYFSTNFRAIYTPTQELSLDEGGMPWRGKLCFKVFQKNKPDKYGVKLYILAEAKSGYVYSFEVYSGTYRSTEDTVCTLMAELMNKGYRLYMDNYYNSVDLCETLYNLGVHACGTMRLVRGAPKVIQTAAKTKLAADTLMTRHKGNTMVMIWQDARVVPLITTLHSDNTISALKRRRTKNAQGQHIFVEKEIRKPVLVDDYNKHMSGVDHFDQMIKYYKITRRTQKWTKKFAFYCMQMCLHNAYVLYKKYSTERPRLTLRKFHENIIRNFIYFKPEEWPHSGRPIHHSPDIQGDNSEAEDDPAPAPPVAIVPPTVQPPPPATTAAPAATTAVPAGGAAAPVPGQRDDVEGEVTQPRKRRASVVPDSELRLNHQLPHTFVKVKRTTRKRCRVCAKKERRRDTQYKCAVCDVFLCLGDCYSSYHQKRQFWL